MPKATITQVTPIGQGKVVKVVFTVDGKPGNAKAWATKRDGSAAFAVGEVCEVAFEKKENQYDGNTTEELWVSKVEPKAFKSGGGRAPDPERAKLDREKFNLDKHKQGLIMSQFVLGQAVAVAIARSGKDPEFEVTTPNIQAIAVDLVAALEEVHGEINSRFSTSEV